MALSEKFTSFWHETHHAVFNPEGANVGGVRPDQIERADQALGRCCQSAKAGQIGTREDYYYEEPVLSSLRVLL